MKRVLTVAVVVGVAAGAAGCGGDDTKTVTVGGPPSEPANTQTSPPATTAAPPSTEPPAPEPTLPALPGGRAAVEGRYVMDLRDSSFTGENVVAGSGLGDGTWPISTQCTGDSCRVTVRRELPSGAYKTEVLDEVKDRSYAAMSTGRLLCGSPRKDYPSRQRVSLRVSGVEERNGRLSAVRVDAYLSVRSACPGSGPTTAAWSWRGSLER